MSARLLNTIFEWAKRAISDPSPDGLAFTGTADVDLAVTYGTFSRGIYIAGNGDIKVDFLGMPGGAAGATAITFVGVVAGTILPICVTKIYDAGTTVSGVVLF